MPSQRATNKRCIATWVPKDLKKDLEQTAREEGIPLSQLVERLYRGHLRQKKKGR
jgi:hypothetical protein